MLLRAPMVGAADEGRLWRTIIRHAVWLYLCFTLSYRDVEDLLAERGLDVSYETVRRWVSKFGPMFAQELRRRRPRPTSRWHLDEMAVMIAGQQFWLWRAVDHEGEVLEAVVTARRDKAAALKLLKRIMKNYGRPQSIVTDRLRAYSAAMKEIGAADRHEVGGAPQQSRREFASAVSTTGAGDAAVSKYEDAAEIQFSSRPGPQPFQSGAASRHPAGLQAETLDRIGGVARPCGIDRRLRAGVSRYASTNAVTLTTPMEPQNAKNLGEGDLP